MREVAVITGGAGGMGLTTAEIVGRDRSVVICDVDEDRLNAAAAHLAHSEIECTTVVCDITDQQSVAKLVEAASALGPIASVIHTAGVSPNMGAADRIMRINAVGTVNINEAFLQGAHPGCAIVNVASMAAHMLPRILIPTKRFEYALRDQGAFMQKMMSVCNIAPTKSRPGLAYSLSKSFVLWYCMSQAGKFGRRGARILSVSPGSIDTQMGRLEEESGAGAMVEYAALKRFGKPEEVAEVLAFCASDKAGYLTGTDILCDGGVTASMTLRKKLAVGRVA
jgi:NAD(P)-dependent dehydrogenase (short-subunit alcohol dehydrogenase family)